MIDKYGDLYVFLVPADENLEDPTVICGKVRGSITSTDYRTINFHAAINTRLNDSHKEADTVVRLASAIKNDMNKIEQEDKQARFDELIDKIAAEHREPCKTKKLPDWYEDLVKSRICIVFNKPFEYNCFRAEYSDVLLLPLAHDIYANHPEIAENKWPVIIRAECYYGAVKTTWSIAQSDYRKRRTISGLDWFEYDELEDYDCAKTCNENCWVVALKMRGKNASAPGEKREDEDNEKL